MGRAIRRAFGHIERADAVDRRPPAGGRPHRSPLLVPPHLTRPSPELRGGSAITVWAREAARRYLGGDTDPAAEQAWREHALPLYGGDQAVRRARARINDDVQAHFRRGGCGPADATGYTAAITCPSLILAGEDDPVSPAVGAARLADALTGARAEILPAVGHGVFRQAPEVAFRHLRRFLTLVG